jgi:hypothetical protein
MIPDGVRINVVNASPKIGDDPSARFGADLPHLKKVIDDFQPDKILACGNVAQAAMIDLGQEYVAAPHPAWRFLSKKMTADIKQQLSQEHTT